MCFRCYFVIITAVFFLLGCSVEVFWVEFISHGLENISEVSQWCWTIRSNSQTPLQFISKAFKRGRGLGSSRATLLSSRQTLEILLCWNGKWASPNCRHQQQQKKKKEEEKKHLKHHWNLTAFPFQSVIPILEFQSFLVLSLSVINTDTTVYL